MRIQDIYIGKKFEFGGLPWVVSEIQRDSFTGRELEGEEKFRTVDLPASLIDAARWV